MASGDLTQAQEVDTISWYEFEENQEIKWEVEEYNFNLSGFMFGSEDPFDCEDPGSTCDIHLPWKDGDILALTFEKNFDFTTTVEARDVENDYFSAKLNDEPTDTLGFPFSVIIGTFEISKDGVGIERISSFPGLFFVMPYVLNITANITSNYYDYFAFRPPLEGRGSYDSIDTDTEFGWSQEENEIRYDKETGILNNVVVKGSTFSFKLSLISFESNGGFLGNDLYFISIPMMMVVIVVVRRKKHL